MTGVISSESNNTTSYIFRLAAFLMLVGSGMVLLLLADFDLGNLLQNVQQTNPLNFLIFMVLLPLIGFPISAFYLFAGSAYPWWQATLLCSLSLAINISVAYPIAKHLLKAPISHFLNRYRKQLPELTEQNQFRVTFLVRSIPGIPYFMQNYMLPLVGVRFPHYFIISWSIQSVFAAGMSALPHLVRQSGWIPAGIVLSLIALLVIFRKVYIRDKMPDA